MSIPSNTGEPDGTPPGGGGRSKLMKAAAAAAAAAALVFGAKAIAGNGATASTADAAAGRPAQPFNGYGTPPGMRGAGRPGRGFGAEVTGATLTRLKDAVSSKYPGTVEHALKLPDGSYEVHVIKSDGSEVRVHVSKAFAVLGVEQGGPGGFRGGGGQGGPPPGMGFGAGVTGSTLTRLKDAVASKYPGTVERAFKLPDGSYVVHVIKSNGSEVQVHVSKAFAVLGAEQGGPGHGGMPPGGGPTTPGSAPAGPGTQS